MTNRLLTMVSLALLALALGVGACSNSKSSAIEGNLVDWNDQPVAGMKIIAVQVQPIKGYEQFQAVTASNGTFRVKGLFPSSAYVLKPCSDKWICNTGVKMDSAPQGETAMLPEPMQIVAAYTEKGGSEVGDLVTGAIRIEVSAEGVISDRKTELDWLIGPDRDTNYAQAEQWVATCTVAGGGWRMPTRAELYGLYQRGVGERNMNPVFKTTGSWVWAEPRDSSSAWGFYFILGGDDWDTRSRSKISRVFGVRSRPNIRKR